MTVSKQTRRDESILSRWSRRKLEAENEVVDSAPAAEVPAAGEVDAQNAQQAEEKPLTDADMPALETLNEDSDFSGFMSSGVSDELRNLALRKLFHAPVFNIRDGLDEYDEDYTSFEKLGDIVTCDMKHQAEMQEKKRREAQELEQQQAALLDETEDDGVEALEDDEDVDLDVDDGNEPEELAALDDAGDGHQFEQGAEKKPALTPAHNTETAND